MSILFIFLFLLLSVFLGVINYKKASIFSGAIAVISFIAVGNGWLPAYLIGNLQQPYQQRPSINWQKNNILILFGAGTSKIPNSNNIKPSLLSFSRIAETATLYRECKATSATCHILISGNDPLHHGKAEAAVYQDSFLSLGIDSKDIELEPRSKNTLQNARFTSYLLKRQANDQLLFISSGLTLKRSLLYLAYFNIHPIPIAADFITIPIAKFPLAYNFAMNDFAAHEYLGIIRFHLYNLFGWNKNTNN